MHFLTQTRTYLVAGLAGLAVAAGAGAAAAPASAATAFCNAGPKNYMTHKTVYAQCQIAEYNISLRARALCRSGQVASSEWKVHGANTRFIGRNRRRNWSPNGFEPLRCGSGVRKLYVDGSYDPKLVNHFPILVG